MPIAAALSVVSLQERSLETKREWNEKLFLIILFLRYRDVEADISLPLSPDTNTIIGVSRSHRRFALCGIVVVLHRIGGIMHVPP
mmetsp:Transcript_7488/g.11850  ORF Transcript_7488/g.11850 Transcript_7488/m.11850 type:complete len:85 (+) Transcript_7488:720-974(+)